MQLRLLKLFLAGVAALAFATVRPAYAGDDGTDDSGDRNAHAGDHGLDHAGDHPGDTGDDDSDKADTGDKGDTGDKTANTDHADPATKTLPSHASATAQANAFGQQGARQKAAHQAAKNAAVKEAQNAAHANTPTLPPQAGAGRAHAQGNGKPASPGSQGQHGLDIAKSHGAHGHPGSH